MPRRVHYAWVIVAVTALTLLLAAGVRAAPGMLIVPLEREFGWDRASISLAVAVSLLVYGVGGTVGGGLQDRFGPRRIGAAALLAIAVGLAGMLTMRALWQLWLFWGLLVGIGTGGAGSVLGATIAQRWFRRHRGLVLGLFSGASSAGQLAFLPSLVLLEVSGGWRLAIGAAAVVVAVLLVPVLVFMRDRPESVGLRPYGADGDAVEDAADLRRTPLRVALRSRDFWLLAGSFFVCGFTSNGLIGTHLIPNAVDHGFTEVTAAGAVGLMGAMNVVGTLTSGWLTDRYDNRKLLATYFELRALSLVALPLVANVPQLLLFAVVYGLDWIATVPPTVNLTASIFGRGSVGTLYGWIFFTHMIGAALAAYSGGLFHELLGSYNVAFVSAALMGFAAGGIVMRITPQRAGATTAEPAAVPAS